MGKEEKLHPEPEEEKSVGEIELPADVQKRMLEFFMQTSIPRIKANKENNKEPLSKKTKE